MKKIYLFLIVLQLITFKSLVGQSVKCDDLITHVERNGRFYQSVGQVQLMNSSWLQEVKAFFIENQIVVIATIKRDQWGINTKKYIFCNIKSTDWTSFYLGLDDLNRTYGERFQKYIFNNRCNCE